MTAAIEKFNVKLCIMLPLIIAVTLILWFVPAGFYGMDGLTVVEQRTIAIFVFTALMWMFEVIPTWTTSVISIVIMLLTISDSRKYIYSEGILCSAVFLCQISRKMFPA